MSKAPPPSPPASGSEQFSPIKKFTPLAIEQIKKIVDDVILVAPTLPLRVKAVVDSGQYSSLISGYESASAENKLQFLNENLQKIAEFLRDCKLIGYQGEQYNQQNFNASSFIVGADGVTVISSYLKNKEKNLAGHNAGHNVKVVRNINLQTKQEPISQRHINIFLEQKFIHENLYLLLSQDLQDFRLKETSEEFKQTYLIETFGTVGGNHFVALTIRKLADEKKPLVYLFDPSPAVVRNGLEAAQNSVAIGWCSQLIINATVKKSFADNGLAFNNDNFFNNSEPLQRTPLSLCATFAYEAAHEIANLNRVQLEELLQHYKFVSPYGGKTEMPINLDEMIAQNDGYLSAPANLGVKPPALFMSHFVDTALKPRLEELQRDIHVIKKRENVVEEVENCQAESAATIAAKGVVESVAERIVRYQTATGENTIAEQKTLRQKMGHLFEIVASDNFLERTVQPVLAGHQEHKKIVIEGSPYFRRDEPKFSQEIETMIDDFKKILPRNVINHLSYDEKKEKFSIGVCLGNTTANKLETLVDGAQIVGLEMESKTINLSDNFVGVDERLSELQKITLTIPQNKFAEFMKKIEGQKLYNPNEQQPFAPPKATAPMVARKMNVAAQEQIHE